MTAPGELDLHLLGEGRHERLWEQLGAHALDDEAGARFAVWAPNARSVSVVGDWNFWSEGADPLEPQASSGVWAGVAPNAREGHAYKLAVRGADGVSRVKADPFAFRAEAPPATASVLYRSRYTWTDARVAGATCGGESSRLSDVGVRGASRLVAAGPRVARPRGRALRARGGARLHARRADAGHAASVWALVGLPGDRVLRPAGDAGRAGPPAGARRPAPPARDRRAARLGARPLPARRVGARPLRRHGAVRACGPAARLAPRLGHARLQLRRATRCGTSSSRTPSTGWRSSTPTASGSTPSRRCSTSTTRASPASGCRTATAAARTSRRRRSCAELNAVVHGAHPGVAMIAEESTAWPGVSRPTDGGGLGFTFKWNMGWMHDTLDYVAQEPVHRRWHHDELTFSLVYAWDENFVLPLSHDEVVHGKGPLLRKIPGDEWQQFATLRALYGHMWAHPGKQLLFMGGEIGQGTEWSQAGSLDWYVLDYPLHEGVRRCVADLNRAYRAEPALWEVDFRPEGFEWLVGDAREDNVLAYARFSADRSRVLVCLVNFSPGRPPPLARAAAGRGGLGARCQHRRGGVRRVGRREPRRRRGPRRAATRPALLRGADAAAARCGLARAERLRTRGSSLHRLGRSPRAWRGCCASCRAPAAISPPVSLRLKRITTSSSFSCSATPAGGRLDLHRAAIVRMRGPPHQACALELVEVACQRRALDPDEARELMLGGGGAAAERREDQPDGQASRPPPRARR